MKPFSKRNKIKKEYSGYGEASIELRNRLLQLHGSPYSGNEYQFGIGNTNWIHEKAFDKDLQMHFGRKFSIENFRDETKTTYDNVFDFIELYYNRALQDLDFNKRNQLYNDICSAFKNSGSVYEFNIDGEVILALDKKTAKKITVAQAILEPYADARGKFRNSTDGLINRSIDPADAIGNMYIVFEDYIKNITSQNSFENSLRSLKNNLLLHPIQIKLIKNLKDYRGDVWGSAHAGNSPKPTEKEALWYLDIVLSQFIYIDRKTK
jgi:hypothetical protein